LLRSAWILEVDPISIVDLKDDVTACGGGIPGDDTQFLELVQCAHTFSIQLGRIPHRQGFLESCVSLR
jgi:hypothetical protein